MKYLLKSVTILDSSSSFHHQKKDILIEEGIISNIADHIEDNEAVEIKEDGLIVTKGWVDIKSRLCDPGQEHKETIETALDSAAFGGFTHICAVPSTTPIADNKTVIEYQINRANNHVVQLHPYGTFTAGMNGVDMAEYYDMQQSGAVAFYDDNLHVDSGNLYRALRYAKPFGAQLVISSLEPHISRHAVVNEGYVSAKTGLKPSPSVAEWMEVNRNIDLAKYTNGKLHLTGITTKESVEIIEKAKKDGVQITADVQIEHLIFTENENLNFDTNFRFEPVLRTEEDRKALWAGLMNGTIDYIAVDHRPCDSEEKCGVFEDASPGVIRLQTAINELSMASEFDLETILEILSNRNRHFIGQEEYKIEINSQADLTVYAPTLSWTFDEDTLLSKSSNTYMLGKNLTGKVVGVFNKGNVYLK